MNAITFMVVTFNQKELILQTLESIKYQVSNFLNDYSIQLIVTDDCSNDGTSDVVKSWVKGNANFFSIVDININSTNKGISGNLIAGLRLVKGDYLKMVAGDDLLPFDSIRPFFKLLDYNDIVMGLPLYFCDDGSIEIDKEKSEVHRVRELSCDRKCFLQRLERDCFIHSPSVFLKSSLVTDIKVVNFIKRFEFLDDYPMWYAIAIKYPDIRYKFCDRIAILYRRTQHSAIYIRKNLIARDRIKLARIIAARKGISFYDKLVKYNELIAFRIGTRWAMKYLIVNNYIQKLSKMFSHVEINDGYELYFKWIDKNRKYIEDIRTSVNNEHLYHMNSKTI